MPRQFKLLTIDRDIKSLMFVKDVVAHHTDFHVTHLESMALVQDVLQYQGFELIVCDYVMASADDFQLVRSLRKNYPDAAILLLVSSVENHFSFGAIEAGADGFFNKPFDYEKFTLACDRGYWKALDRLDWWEANETIFAGSQAAGI